LHQSLSKGERHEWNAAWCDISATGLKSDRIAVLDRGRVVETGSHADLMRMDGLYRRLATLQSDQPLAVAAAQAANAP
jgi:hypothetical protein